MGPLLPSRQNQQEYTNETNKTLKFESYVLNDIFKSFWIVSFMDRARKMETLIEAGRKGQ